MLGINEERRMVLPIISWGNRVLKKRTSNIKTYNSEINQLVIDMWHTLDAAKCCGLAAPQVGHSKSLFIVDSKVLFEKLTEEGRKRFWGDTGIRQTFINAEIIETEEMTWTDPEECMSIPSVKIDVERPISIRIKYQDEHMQWHEEEYGGMTARIIQHECDHINGKLITDHLQHHHKKPLLYKWKLKRIKDGKVNTKYKMLFP